VSTRFAALAGIAAVVACAAIASAQGGGKPVTGNPTPGTAQPEPPNVADRVTFAGCLQPVRSSATTPVDSNTPSNSRFELAKAERVDRVPPGTGGSADAASAWGWISVRGKWRKAKRTRPESSRSTRSIARKACREYGHS